MNQNLADFGFNFYYFIKVLTLLHGIYISNVFVIALPFKIVTFSNRLTMAEKTYCWGVSGVCVIIQNENNVNCQ